MSWRRLLPAGLLLIPFGLISGLRPKTGGSSFSSEMHNGLRSLWDSSQYGLKGIRQNGAVPVAVFHDHMPQLSSSDRRKSVVGTCRAGLQPSRAHCGARPLDALVLTLVTRLERYTRFMQHTLQPLAAGLTHIRTTPCGVANERHPSLGVAPVAQNRLVERLAELGYAVGLAPLAT